jgi:hypothetical protein
MRKLLIALTLIAGPAWAGTTAEDIEAAKQASKALGQTAIELERQLLQQEVEDAKLCREWVGLRKDKFAPVAYEQCMKKLGHDAQ